MSYYKCKNITMNKKKNLIRITIADSSLRPLSFYTVTLGTENDDFDEKCRSLFEQLYTRNIQCYLSVKNGSFESAEQAWKAMLKQNYDLSQTELWELSYQADHESDPKKKADLQASVKQIKEECYQIWKSELEL